MTKFCGFHWLSGSWSEFTFLCAKAECFARLCHRLGVKEGYPPKKDVILPLLARIMWKRLQIGTYMLLIITSTGDRLFGFINIDDLERPWTPQKEVSSEFFAIFGCSAHFNTELRLNGRRQTKITCVWNFQHSA